MAPSRQLLLVPIAALGALCLARLTSAEQQGQPSGTPLFSIKPQEGWLPELAFLAFALVYIAQIVLGRAKNEGIAVAWTREVWQAGGRSGGRWAIGRADGGRHSRLL